jgi:hypothetical protein
MVTISNERIAERARAARPGLVVLTVISTVFIVLGWLTGRLLGFGWLALVWPFAAIQEGWTQGFRDTPWDKARQVRAQARAAARA